MDDLRSLRMENTERCVKQLENVFWHTAKVSTLTLFILWGMAHESIYKGLSAELPIISMMLWTLWGFMIVLTTVEPVEVGCRWETPLNFYVLTTSIDFVAFLTTLSWHYVTIHVLLVIIDSIITKITNDADQARYEEESGWVSSDETESHESPTRKKRKRPRSAFYDSADFEFISDAELIDADGNDGRHSDGESTEEE